MVSVSWDTSTSTVLLVTETPDPDGVCHRAHAVRRQRLHIENVDSFLLSEDFKTVQTSSLFNIGRHGSGLGSRGHQILFAVNICDMRADESVSNLRLCRATVAEWRDKY